MTFTDQGKSSKSAGTDCLSSYKGNSVNTVSCPLTPSKSSGVAQVDIANVVSMAHRMITFSRPTSKDYCNVRHFISNRENECTGVNSRESTWINHKYDLVTIRPGRDHAWLDSTIEAVLKKMHCNLIEV